MTFLRFIADIGAVVSIVVFLIVGRRQVRTCRDYATASRLAAERADSSIRIAHNVNRIDEFLRTPPKLTPLRFPAPNTGALPPQVPSTEE